MKTTKKKEVKKVAKYVATIKVLGKNYTSVGQTPREAVENLDVGKNARGVSVLSVSNGSQVITKIIPTVQTYRLFCPSRLQREIALKGVSSLFDL